MKSSRSNKGALEGKTGALCWEFSIWLWLSSSLTYNYVFCIFNPTKCEFAPVIFKKFAKKINVEFLSLPMVSDVTGRKRLKVDFQGETVKDVIDELIRPTEAVSAKIICR